MHSAQIKSVREIIDRNGNIRESISKVFPMAPSYINLKVRTKDGIVVKEMKIPFKSYVSNFARVLQHAWLAVVNDTGGVAPNKVILTNENFPADDIHTMKVVEGALSSPTATNYGIWIGDYEDLFGGGGVLPVNADMGGQPNFDDYNFLHRIPADGSESMDTNCEYRATFVSLESSDNKLVVKRRFQNDDVSEIIYVSEIGLVAASGTDYFLIARDVPVREPNGSGSEASYKIDPTMIKEVQYVFEITDNSGWTKNYLKYLSSEFYGGNSLAALSDTNGATSIMDFKGSRTYKNMLATVTDDAFGIQIGGYVDPGGTIIVPPKTTSSYKLYNKITNSLLGYGAVEVIPLEQLNGNTTFGCRRDFENTGSDTYYIYEAGNVIKHVTAPKYFMLNAETFATPSILYPGEIFRYKTYYVFPLNPTF